MIHWHGHASTRIDASKIIYIDPWEIKSGPKADIILITHSHYDHLSEPDIKKLSKPETEIVCTADSAAKLKGNVHVVKPGDVVEVCGVKIEAVSSYNLHKQFHPRSNNWVGYIINIDGKRIYQAGDTDLIPEMKEIDVDIAMLPIGGTYTMTAEEAATACEWIKTKEVIPIHWGKVVGSEKDVEEFKKSCKSKVTVLTKE